MEEEIEEEKYDEIKECKELEKCELCNKESILEKLCQKCNNQKGYYFLNFQIADSPNSNGFIECIKKEEKPSNFYFNAESNDFRICYETCATCDYGGDGNKNNCSSCESGYILKPDIANSNNCVLKCEYYYYYTDDYYYRCTDSLKCPENFNYLIEEKRKCIDKCENDDLYRFHYNKKCFKECPHNTTKNSNDFKCIDKDLDKCKLSEEVFISINENITDDDIEPLVQNYIDDYNYTNNHVSIYKNKLYTITIYKNGYCISELKMSIPEINFGNCYEKVKTNNNIDTDLIIVIITKNIEGKTSTNMLNFSMHEPEKGEELSTNICKNDTFEVQESLLTKIDNNKNNIDILLFLAEQSIDIFNLSSAFYTDICFHFNSPIDKDISLKDRVLLYYPNITLCENGCHTKGVNLTTFKSLCECKLNNLINNNLFENNLIYQNTIGEITELISKTNIEVIKCYKYLSDSKYLFSNVGVYIIFIFLIIQTVLTIIYFSIASFLIKKYIFSITEKYLSYLSIENNGINIDKNTISSRVLLNPPIKRKSKKLKEKTKPESNKINNIMSNKGVPINYNFINNKNYNLSLNELSNNTKKSTVKFSLSSKFNINKNNLMTSKDNNNFNMNEYLATELNDMDYDDAIKKDKRKFCNYFYEKLKINQIILNTFCAVDPLRPRVIKIMLFVFEIDLYLFVNGLFFN